MDMRQIKWDHVVIGNYKMRNCSIIAYLQSFLMNVGRKKLTLRKINVTSTHTELLIELTPPCSNKIFFFTPEQNEDL